MEKIVLQAEPRNVIGKQVKALRRQGKLPAVLYGHHTDPIPVLMDARSTGRALEGLSASHLITIEVGGTQHTALVRQKQRHPVRGDLIHIDFLVVSMTEKLRTDVSLAFEGESPAVEDQLGVMMTNLETVTVESLPGDLPNRIAVDISGLHEIGDAIYVRDLQVPSGVIILTDPEEAVVLITGVTAEVEEEGEEKEKVEGEPEVIERGKKEEEEE